MAIVALLRPGDAQWRRRLLLGRSIAAVLVFVAATVACGEPYTPTSDDEVLERLPPGLGTPRGVARDSSLAQDAENLRASLELADRYLRTAESDGDTRFHGYARSILRPWWTASPRPPGVALVQARIHLARWEWDDVEAVLVAMDPPATHAPPAMLLKAEAALGKGNVEWARSLTDGLSADAPASPHARVRAEILRRTGRTAEALRLVEDGSRTGGAESTDRMGDRLLHADLLLQLGRADEAESVMRDAQRQAPSHAGVLAAMADLLLDCARPAEAAAVLERATLNDALELRVLEALVRLPAPAEAEAARRGKVLDDWLERVERRRDRGDVTALPLLVRAYQRLRPDAVRAIACAKELWAARPDFHSVQRCLEAAAGGGSEGRELMLAVSGWVSRHGAVDARWPRIAISPAREGTP